LAAEPKPTPPTEPSDSNLEEPAASGKSSSASSSGDDADDVGPAEGEGEGTQENRRARRAALSKARKQRLRERQEAEAVGLDTQEVIDEALVRTSDTAAKWIRRNSTILQGALVVGLVGWAAWGGYGLWTAKVRAEASDIVAKALASEAGKIGDPSLAGQPDDQGIVDPRPVFKDDQARLVAAETALVAASKVREGSGTSLYARLALASVELDQGKPDEALANYKAVLESKLGQKDPELRGRALEGTALALEKKGDKVGALARYQELVSSGKSGFVESALLDQARLQRDLGKAEEAKASLKLAREKLAATPSLDGPGSYLRQRLEGLAADIDPELAKTLRQPPALTPERLKELQEQVKKAMGNEAPEPASSEAP
jgi:tetratricopeptide (TPR) repeat protein